jgi:pimeloyl-ACP methyl ester carboxylesterase
VIGFFHCGSLSWGSFTGHLLVLLIGWCGTVSTAHAIEHNRYGAELDGFNYPHEVQRFYFKSQGVDMSMAYMDVKPERPNGRTLVLLHGRNFCAATWEQTIKVLSDAGYRVVAPDQIGFCKSTKPLGYQFTVQQLARNTNALLESLGITRASIIGHSFGGMMALRYALMFPDAVEQLVLVNPIGLEDWQAKGVPYVDLDKGVEIEKTATFDSIKQYEQKFYYAGQWKPEYDRWVEMLAGMYTGPGREIVTITQARIAEMIFTQPVVHEFERVRVPTVLLIGQLDRTAPGSNRAPTEIAKALGNYPVLGREAEKRIPNAKLIELPKLGHAPQIQAPAQFHGELLRALKGI